MFRTQHFHCHGRGSIPGQGTKMLQAAQHGLKKKWHEMETCRQTKKIKESVSKEDIPTHRMELFKMHLFEKRTDFNS